jgi:hypothetical protein
MDDAGGTPTATVEESAACAGSIELRYPRQTNQDKSYSQTHGNAYYLTAASSATAFLK